MISCNPHNKPNRWVLLFSPSYRQGNLGTERLIMELEMGAGKTLAASLILNYHGRGDASHTEGEGIAYKVCDAFITFTY